MYSNGTVLLDFKARYSSYFVVPVLSLPGVGVDNSSSEEGSMIDAGGVK